MAESEPGRVMPFFAETISFHSPLPPGALLDRVRGLATGKLTMPRQPRWRSPVMWLLREQPGAIRLMPLSPPNYRTQQPSFIGTIEPEGSGSRVTGRVAPYALTVGITAFLLLIDAAMTTGGVVQEFSRHRAGQALGFALFGIAFAAVAVSMLQLGVKWAAADIRRLLATAASSDPRQPIDDSTIQPPHPLVPGPIGQSSRSSFVLRSAAIVDLLIALLFVATPLASSRVGRPAAFLIAAVLASGAGVLLSIAGRLGSRRSM